MGWAMTEPVSVFAAAKHIGEASGWTLTHLQMQKLLYIAHMYYMGKIDEPLILGNFEAWDYGPVHPLLYHRLKIYGADPVPPEALSFASLSDESQSHANCLDATVAGVNLDRLVTITHWEEGAWALNYKPGAKNIRISNEDIKKEFSNWQTSDE